MAVNKFLMFNDMITFVRDTQERIEWLFTFSKDGEVVISDKEMEVLKAALPVAKALKKNLWKLMAEVKRTARKANVKVIGQSPDMRFECNECKERWMPGVFQRGGARYSYWKCPNGCNSKAKGA